MACSEMKQAIFLYSIFYVIPRISLHDSTS